MASLELRNETYCVVFMLGGRKYGYSLDTGVRSTAEAPCGEASSKERLVARAYLRDLAAGVMGYGSSNGNLPAPRGLGFPYPPTLS
jgi:hypothetical protein